MLFFFSCSYRFNLTISKSPFFKFHSNYDKLHRAVAEKCNLKKIFAFLKNMNGFSTSSCKIIVERDFHKVHGDN